MSVPVGAIPLFIVTTLAAFTISVANAVVLSDPNDRLITPGQPAYGVNLDGVALLGAAYSAAPQSLDDLAFYCTASLISSRHILTAAHCLDEDFDGRTDAIITAFPLFVGFELTDRNVLLRVNTANVRYPPGDAANADLAVLELFDDAPSEIPRYPLYGLADEVGRAIVIAGYGATGHGAMGVDAVASEVPRKRTGRNLVRGRSRGRVFGLRLR